MPLRILAAILTTAVLWTGPARDAGAATDPTTAYFDARTQLEQLAVDSENAKYRKNWIRLADQFTALYRDNPGWQYRAAAMYRSGNAYEGLYHRSFNDADAVEAARRYLTVTREFPNNVLADDALFVAARVQADCLKNTKAAKSLLRTLLQNFPKGDMVPRARLRLAELENIDPDPAGHEGVKAAATAKPVESKPAPTIKAPPVQKPPQTEKVRDSIRKPAATAATLPLPKAPSRTAKPSPRASVPSPSVTKVPPAPPAQAVRKTETIPPVAPEKSSTMAKVGKAPVAPQKTEGSAKAGKVPAESEKPAVTAKTGKSPAITVKAGGKGPATVGGAPDRKTDMRPAAKGVTPAPAPTPPPDHSATLISLSCSATGTSVRLVLDTDNPVPWAIFSSRLDPRTGSTAKISIEFPSTTADKVIPKKKYYKGMLETLTVSRTKSGTLCVVLGFRKLVRFLVSPGNTPEAIVIEATSQENRLYNGRQPGETIRSTQKKPGGRLVIPQDIITQLGLSAKSVIIDAGHGGRDPGALGNDITEKNITLDMAKRIGARLKRKGFIVRTTRDRDVHVSLGDRARFANEVKGDIFLSIHINSNTETDISGVETYYLNFAKSDSAARVAATENAVGERNLGSMEEMIADIMLGTRTQESKKLGYAIQRSIIASLTKSKFSTNNNGVRSAPLAVLMGSTMPGVLVELGYCSNRKEAKRLIRQDYRNALAEGIAEGVIQYVKALGG